MSGGKLLGYYYWICEFSPGPNRDEDFTRKIVRRDNIEDAEKVLAVLYETDYNFSVYGLYLEPVYSQRYTKEEELGEPKKSFDQTFSALTVIDEMFHFSDQPQSEDFH